jgi:hypothetical protein
MVAWREGAGGDSATQFRWWTGIPDARAGKTTSGVVRWRRRRARSLPGGHDEDGGRAELAPCLEAEAEGDGGLAARPQNGGGPIWGVPRGVRKAWGGAGGRQGANVAVAGRAPTA